MGQPASQPDRFFNNLGAGLWTGLVRDEQHGPLPGLLVLLTVVAGIVDAVTILRLDDVFVANITGNIIFVGLALTGAHGFSIPAPLLALMAFVGGAAGGSVLVRHRVSHRGKALRNVALFQLADLVACTGIVAAAHDHPGAGVRYLLIVLLAAGMGLQSSIVRRVNVPGLTTVVFTTTLTGLASDGFRGGWRDAQYRVRVLATFALLGGVIAGALFVLDTSLWCPLAVASGLLLATAWLANRASAVAAPWTAFS
jgi:uncharacterized membrane protein YoaK (UPF0700 family)